MTKEKDGERSPLDTELARMMATAVRGALYDEIGGEADPTPSPEPMAAEASDPARTPPRP